MKRIKDMVAEANEVVSHAAASDMMALHSQEGVTFVDLRDPRELERDGMIPGAFHCPRGMLEFWIDPESPYAKPQFQSGDRFVFYCASGWRSALSARAAGKRLAHQRRIQRVEKGWWTGRRQARKSVKPARLVLTGFKFEIMCLGGAGAT